MESVQSLVLCTCCVSIALTIAELLAPSVQFQRQLRLLFSLLLLIGIVTPVAGGEFSLPTLSEPQLSETAAAAYAQTDTEITTLAQENLSRSIATQLAAADIACTKIETQIHIDESGCISISKVRIASADFSAASALISALLGTDVPIDEMEEVQ